jgi:hypothetical protein
MYAIAKEILNSSGHFIKWFPIGWSIRLLKLAYDKKTSISSRILDCFVSGYCTYQNEGNY